MKTYTNDIMLIVISLLRLKSLYREFTMKSNKVPKKLS